MQFTLAELKDATVARLRSIAQELDLVGYSDLRKEDLILLVAGAMVSQEEKEALLVMTAVELRANAKDMGLTGYSKLNKTELAVLILMNQPPSIEEAEEVAEVEAKKPAAAPKPPPQLKPPSQPRLAPSKKRSKVAAPVSEKVLEHVELVRASMRQGVRQIRLPYVSDKVTKAVMARLTRQEKRRVSFGGSNRGSIS